VHRGSLTVHGQWYASETSPPLIACLRSWCKSSSSVDSDINTLGHKPNTCHVCFSLPASAAFTMSNATNTSTTNYTGPTYNASSGTAEYNLSRPPTSGRRLLAEDADLTPLHGLSRRLQGSGACRTIVSQSYNAVSWCASSLHPSHVQLRQQCICQLG
jgi:hypothetical protein